MTSVDRLATMAAFRGVAADHLAQLATHARAEHHPAGTLLALEAQDADCFFVVDRGRLAIELHAPGREPHVVAVVGPGHLVGWSWRYPPRTWHFDVVALDAVDVVRFDAPGVLGALAADPTLDAALSEVVARTMARRLDAARLQLLDLYGPRP